MSARCHHKRHCERSEQSSIPPRRRPGLLRCVEIVGYGADGIDIVAGAARPMPMEHAISNGFGFGGVNTSAIFRRMG